MTAPLAGKEGKFVTSRQLRDRLYRELLKDVSLRVSDGETTDEFRVAGRGEMPSVHPDRDYAPGGL